MNKFTLLDVGANWGTDSLLQTQNDPNKHCWAFEPTPELVNHLRSQSSSYRDRYTVVEAALSDFDGKASFNIADQVDWGCSSLNTFSENLNETWPGRTDLHFNRSIEVNVYRFDTWYEKNNKPFTKIDYFHCDTQGSDLRVLIGMGEYIEMIQHGIVECATSENVKLYKENHTEEEMSDFLSKNGFIITKRLSNDHFNNEVNIYFSKSE